MRWLWLIPLVAVVLYLWRHAGRDARQRDVAGMRPYYSDGGIDLYHGDARDYWTTRGVAHCVVFSPPYNVGLDYQDIVSDAMPWDEYRELAGWVATNTQDALTESGRVWCNVVPSVPLAAGDHSGRGTATRVNLLQLWGDQMERAGINYRDTISWNSTHNRAPDTAWGSWQSPSGPNLRGNWEAIWVGSRGPWARQMPAERKGWQDREGHWEALTLNTWPIITQKRGGELGGHPAPFPVELARRCIRLSTFPGELVIDPFVGTGSTLLAARQLGRRAIGIELSERSCEIAASRLAQGDLFAEVPA